MSRSSDGDSHVDDGRRGPTGAARPASGASATKRAMRQRFLEGIEMWTFVGMMVFLVLLGLLMAGASIATDAAARMRKAADRERRWKQWQDL